MNRQGYLGGSDTAAILGISPWKSPSRVKIKDIPGFEGFYAASKDGGIYSIRNEKFLTPVICSSGYAIVCISINGSSINKSIHRLVALTFIENPNNHPQINHINGIKHDNRIENLEWCTASMNQKHAVLMGLSKPTEKSRKASANNIKNYGRTKRILTEEQVIHIRASSLSCVKMGQLYGVSPKTIHLIRTRRTYADIR